MFIPEDPIVYFPKLNKLYSYTSDECLETMSFNPLFKYYVWCFSVSLQPCWYLLGLLQSGGVLRAFGGMGEDAFTHHHYTHHRAKASGWDIGRGWTSGTQPAAQSPAWFLWPPPGLRHWCRADASPRGRWGQIHKGETRPKSNQHQPHRLDLSRDMLILPNEQGFKKLSEGFSVVFLTSLGRVYQHKRKTRKSTLDCQSTVLFGTSLIV